MSLRARLSPATVIATIALFAALGGGYSFAFSGSGTLQKAVFTAPPNAGPQDARTLNGFGRLQISCTPIGELTATDVHVKNTSGTDQVVRRFNEDSGTYSQSSIAAGATVGVGSTIEPTTFRLHIFRDEGTTKSQVDVTVSTFPNAAGVCGPVKILALNTVE